MKAYETRGKAKCPDDNATDVPNAYGRPVLSCLTGDSSRNLTEVLKEEEDPQNKISAKSSQIFLGSSNIELLLLVTIQSESWDSRRYSSRL